MYAAVPRIMPTPVNITGEVIVGEFARSIDPLLTASANFANPKSSTFTAYTQKPLWRATTRWSLDGR